MPDPLPMMAETGVASGFSVKLPKTWRVPQAQHHAVRGGDRVAAAVGRGQMPDHCIREILVGPRPEEAGVAEREDAAVGRHQPVAQPSGVAAMAVMGSFNTMPPVLPKKRASPKVKMPPSAATSQ